MQYRGLRAIDILLFNSWGALLRIVIFGFCGYIALVSILRTTGQRTLSTLNAFDFIVTVAIGSTFGTLLLSRDTALVDGIAAFAVLIGMQHVVSWLSMKSAKIKKMVKNEPILLYYKGDYMPENLKRARIVREEIEQSVRSNGKSSIKDVDAVVLETNGNISIVGPGNSNTIDVLGFSNLTHEKK